MKSCNYPYFCKSVLLCYFWEILYGIIQMLLTLLSKIHIEDKATLPEDVFFCDCKGWTKLWMTTAVIKVPFSVASVILTKKLKCLKLSSDLLVYLNDASCHFIIQTSPSFCKPFNTFSYNWSHLLLRILGCLFHFLCRSLTPHHPTDEPLRLP